MRSRRDKHSWHTGKGRRMRNLQAQRYDGVLWEDVPGEKKRRIAGRNHHAAGDSAALLLRRNTDGSERRKRAGVSMAEKNSIKEKQHKIRNTGGVSAARISFNG